MKSNTNTLLLCVLLSCIFAACAGLLNLGSTNEDGTPKSASPEELGMATIAAFAEASMTLWGMPAIREKAPQVIPLFDRNGNGELTVAEIVQTMGGADRESARAAIDHLLRVVVSPGIAERRPALISVFDADGSGDWSLAEIEAKLDLSNPQANAATILAVAAALSIR